MSNLVFLVALSNVVSKALIFVNRNERGRPERVLERDETNAPAHDKWPAKCILNEGLNFDLVFLNWMCIDFGKKVFFNMK